MGGPKVGVGRSLARLLGQSAGVVRAGSTPARSAAVLIRPTGGPRSGGVGYQHECSRLLPLLRCPPLMMIIIGGGNHFSALGTKSAIDDPAGLGAGRRREEGFQRGKLKGGGSRTGGRGGWDGGAVRRTGGEPVGCASGERGPRRRGGGVCDGPSAGSAWLLSPAAPAGLPGVGGAPLARGPPGAAGGVGGGRQGEQP